MKKYIALLFIIPVISLFVGCQKEVEVESEPRPVRAMKIGDITAVSQRWIPGRVSASQEVNLSFRVSGPLVQLPVNVGDQVKKGQVLARIDPRDFEVNMRNAEAQLQRAEAALALAESEYGRVTRIREQDPAAISAAMVDQKREALDRAQAELLSIESTVEAAQDQLRYSTLRAPFSGTIVAKYVENFEDVQAKQVVLRLLDPTHIEMTVDIPENIISYVPLMKNLRVRFDAFPGLEVPAEVKEIGTEASATTRTYPVTLIMEQPEGVTVLAGMTGEATCCELMPDEGLMERPIEVPTEAVFSDEGGGSYVWVIDESTLTVEKREISLGRLTDFGVIVLSGLETGEWIATAGVYYLNEGQEVRILDREAGRAAS
jgi:RND family efflux transporter MFP subunit